MTGSLDKRVADLEYIIAHLPQDLDARFDGVKFKVGEVRDVLSAQGRKIENMDMRLGVMDTRIGAVNVGMNTLNEEVGILKAQVAELKSEFAGQKSELAGVKAEVASLKSGVTAELVDVKSLLKAILGRLDQLKI